MVSFSYFGFYVAIQFACAATEENEKDELKVFLFILFIFFSVIMVQKIVNSLVRICLMFNS